MKIAVIGSKSFNPIDYGPRQLTEFLHPDTDELTTCGNANLVEYVGKCARKFGIAFSEFDSERAGSVLFTDIFCNLEMIRDADGVFIFWDGGSEVMESAVKYCISSNVPFRIINLYFPKSYVKNAD